MFRSVRLLAPVAAAIVATGGGVVAVSRATDSTQPQPRRPKAARMTELRRGLHASGSEVRESAAAGRRANPDQVERREGG